jgi:hypothetical protein
MERSRTATSERSGFRTSDLLAGPLASLIHSTFGCPDGPAELIAPIGPTTDYMIAPVASRSKSGIGRANCTSGVKGTKA